MGSFSMVETFKILGLIFLIVVGAMILFMCCWKVISICTDVAPEIGTTYIPTIDDSYSTIESGGFIYGMPPIPYIKNKYDFKEESVEPALASGRFSDSESYYSSIASSREHLVETSPELSRSLKSVHWKD